MKLSTRQATILLASIISARSTSFIFSKLCLSTMNAFSLIALRFSTASLIIFIIFSGRIISSANRHNILSGIIIGAAFFLVLASEHTGLKNTNASTAAFIENLAIIIVPFLECLISRTLPNKKNLLCAFLALIGVGMLTISNGAFVLSSGEIFLLMAAFFYALAIIITSRLVKKGDALVIGFFQVTTTGILSWLTIACDGSFTVPTTVPQYGMILILAVVCTSFGFTLQPVVQSKLSSETVSSFCAMGPLVASVLSCIFLGERPTMYSFSGAVLILISLVFLNYRKRSTVGTHEKSGNSTIIHAKKP